MRFFLLKQFKRDGRSVYELAKEELQCVCGQPPPTFAILRSEKAHPMAVCAENQTAYISSDPYREFWCLKLYLSLASRGLDGELSMFKTDFWSSVASLNPVYSNYATLWFFQLANQYMRNSLGSCSLIDYLHTIWSTGNVAKSFSKSEMLGAHKDYLTEFGKSLKKPSPFALPPYALVRIINFGFKFGTKAKPINLEAVWHNMYVANLRRIKKGKKWIPPTVWQMPIIYKLSRKRKNDLYEYKYAHKQRVWEWKRRYFQLILIEDYNKRVQRLWSVLHKRVIFYSH